MSEDNEDVRLSARQVECLQRIAGGETSAEIALSLGLSVRTIDHYVRFVCAKLGVRGRAQAVAKALNLKLIQGPEALGSTAATR